MYAVILAAGQGLRLGRLLADKPRCLLHIGGETILDRQMRLLREIGIPEENIVLVTGYKAEMLRSIKCRQVYNSEYRQTDNAYSLGLALDTIKCADSVLVLDGDLIFEKEALADIAGAEETNCFLLKRGYLQSGSTGARVDRNGRILEIGKHLSNSEINYACIMKLSGKAVMDLVPELLADSNKKYWYTVPINRRVSQMDFAAKFTTAKIVGVNTEQDYIQAKEMFSVLTDKILVTGAMGFLGKKLCAVLERDYEVTGVSRHGQGKVQALDTGDFGQVEAFIKLNRPDIIIHTAAIADPEECDRDREKAYSVNVSFTQKLCEVCASENIKMIFISTDYVFDGDSNEEYRENDRRDPKNYYGKTKVMAEDIVRGLAGSLIVRIPIIYGYNDKTDKQTFVTKTIERLAANETVEADDVQVRYPVLIDEVAIAVGQLLHEEGTVQLSSREGVTKYRWAQYIAEVFDLNKDLIRPKAENPKTGRPAHVKMNTDTADVKGVVIHNVKDGLRIMRKQMNCIFRLIYKSDAVDKLYGVTVGNFRYAMGQLIAKTIDSKIGEDADCVIPVPNSGLYYAMGLADALGKPYVQALVKTAPSTRSFNMASTASRERYIKSKIVPIVEMIKGKNIILVDEAIFTGTTLRMVSDIMKACGAGDIHICVPTPICFSRCQQYIQPYRPVLTEQVDALKTAEYFGVESVSYMPCELFVRSIQNIQDYFCYDCFR